MIGIWKSSFRAPRMMSANDEAKLSFIALFRGLGSETVSDGPNALPAYLSSDHRESNN